MTKKKLVSKAVPKKKQKKKIIGENGSDSLRFLVPKNIRLKDYQRHGLLIPGKLSESEGLVPLDFTSISSREVGQQHSYWAVRHSHLIFLVGNLRAEIGNAKHDLKNTEAQWFIKNSAEYKTKWEAEIAMTRSKSVRKLRQQLARAEASLTRYEALAEAYEGLRNAASREISRRLDERASRD